MYTGHNAEYNLADKEQLTPFVASVNQHCCSCYTLGMDNIDILLYDYCESKHIRIIMIIALQ